MEKILRDKAWNMPPILLQRMANAMRNEGRPDWAAIFEAELQRQATGIMEPQKPRGAGLREETLPAEEMGGRPEVPITEG